MLIRDIIKSVTLLSLFQLVFSKRSANNLYSYFCPHSPTRIDIGAAFTLFRIPVNNLCKNNNNNNGMHIHIPPPASKTWGYGKAFPMTVGSPGISTTQRNLFSFNLNDIIKGKGEKEVAPAEDVDVDVDMDVDMDMDIITDENYEVSRLSAWAKRIPKYQQQMKDKTKSLTNGEQDDESDSTSTIKPSFSLSNLINVEALLLASGQVTLDNEADTGTKLLKDMMRQNDGNAVEDNAEDGLTSSSTPSTANMVGVNVDINNAEDQLSWNVLMQSVQQNMKNLVESPTTFKGPSYEFSMAAELALKEATQSIEIFTNYAASSVSPDKVQSLITSATRSLAVDQSADVFKTTMDKVVAVAETLARDQGVDVSDAAAKARASTKYTAEFLRVANGVLVSGYVRGESGTIRSGNEDIAEQLRIPESDDVAKPLFEDFESVESIADEDFQSTIVKGSEMSLLSGAIYEDIVSSTHDLGYSIVANGTAGDVVWMATDSIGYGSDFDQEQDLIDDVESPVLVRTITFRGYDASDESVDREKLLYKICDAESVPFGDETKNLMVHKGLLEVAKEAYDQVIHSIDMSGPNHKIVLNGHSIGGSIAALVLFLLVEERGAEFVNEKVLRVFTFGSPPVVTHKERTSVTDDTDTCSILESLNLRSDIVYGYVQPWDPIVRMFSRIDPLYPLIGDLGDDGVSLYASGPPRTLRPVLRAILESWENWPTFRDDYKGVMNQEYLSIGIQHLLMPDTGRYLTDRLVSVNIANFPVDDVLRISTKDLYSALETAFPLDTFSISLVPTAIRSFIHHFYPAYTDFAEYTDKRKKNMEAENN